MDTVIGIQVKEEEQIMKNIVSGTLSAEIQDETRVMWLQETLPLNTSHVSFYECIIFKKYVHKYTRMRLPNVIPVMKSRRLRRAARLAPIGERMRCIQGFGWQTCGKEITCKT